MKRNEVNAAAKKKTPPFSGSAINSSEQKQPASEIFQGQPIIQQSVFLRIRLLEE
ncbi:hypothetical protein [Treponema sp.]|uniref:hypothetical protein n=1 Tax=Treponema sp. TaxID=166 RepID=UPI003F108E8B